MPFFIVAIVAELAYGLLRGRNTFRLNDSISSLFMGGCSASTGWQPEDIAASHPRHTSDLATFEKYDPAVSPLMSAH